MLYDRINGPGMGQVPTMPPRNHLDSHTGKHPLYIRCFPGNLPIDLTAKPESGDRWKPVRLPGCHCAEPTTEEISLREGGEEPRLEVGRDALL